MDSTGGNKEGDVEHKESLTQSAVFEGVRVKVEISLTAELHSHRNGTVSGRVKAQPVTIHLTSGDETKSYTI